MASNSLSSSVTETQKGGNWGGFTIEFTLVHANAATAFLNSAVNFAAINVTLNIDGRQSSMSLRDFIVLFGYDSAMFTAIRSWTDYSDIMVAQAVGVAEKRKLCFEFRYRNVVNLTSDKATSVTVNPAGAFNGTVDTGASQCEVVFFEGFGTSPGYPIFSKTPAGSGESSISEAIRPNTTKIMVYNHDKSDVLENTAAVTSVSLNTDKGVRNFTYGKLLALRNSMFDNTTDARARYQNFYLMPETGTEFDGGTVTVNFASNNVAADSNGILMESLDVTAGSFVRFAERQQKHAVQQINKLPQGIRQRATAANIRVNPF